MKEINTKVNEVTVFLNKAKIKRAGKISVQKGKQTLSVTGLPAELDPESVRVRAIGSAPVSIYGIDVRRTFFKDIPDGIIRELTEKIEKLSEKKRRVTDQTEILDKKQKHIEGLLNATRIFASGFAKGEITIESHKTLLNFLQKEGDTAIAEIRKKEKESNDIEKEIKKLKEELSLANNSKPREKFTAEISAGIKKECTINVDLTYHISGASWNPEYDIRIGEKNIFIDYLAMIKHTTGEEWKDISMILSTLTPSGTSEIPELDPWFIAPVMKKSRGLDATRDSRVIPMAASVAQIPDSEVSYSEIVRDEFPESIEADLESTEVIKTGTSVSFKVTEPATVPGDGSYHKVKVGSLELKKDLKHITAPKKDERVFRTAESENTEFFLLPGKGQVFENEEYLGPVRISHTAPGEKIKIFAGSDDRIKVTRKLTSKEVDKKFMSDRKKINYSFEITIENFTGEIKEIKVLDQIPVPSHEDIKIKLDECSPKTSKSDELNRFEWEIKVEPGKKSTIRYDYSIEFPREMNIYGLP